MARRPLRSLRRTATLGVACSVIVLVLSAGSAARAQSTVAPGDDTIRRILDRLDRLERENQALSDEVRQLRAERAEGKNTSVTPAPSSTAAAPAPPAEAALTPDNPSAYLPERVSVDERRLEEQAQTKVEASERFPLQVTGMALVNAFGNTLGGHSPDKYLLDPQFAGQGSSGATIRQTILGLRYRGPQTFLGGKVSGSVFIDFAGNYEDSYNTPGGSYSANYPLPRLRTASIGVDWKTRSFTIGQLKPIVSPREPDSLARVATPALADSGNLWLWLPQARFEQRVSLGEGTSLTAQIGVLQTNERWAMISDRYEHSLEGARPAVEGRLQFARRSDRFRVEIAPGFHASTTHVAGASVASRLVSLDGLLSPWRRIQFTGAFFHGQDIASIGSMWQGFTILAPGNVRPVHASGGWAQFELLATDRLAFHVYAGQEDDDVRDLSGGVRRNRSYAANLMYRLAPNVQLGLESGQSRLAFTGGGHRIRNYYDLALAYFF